MKSTSQEENLVKGDDKPKTMKKTWWRWYFLVCLNFVGLGYNFGNNVPSAVSAYIKDYWSMSIVQLNSLNYVYAFPNAIIPFLGGLAMDKYGLRITSVIFTFVNILGFLWWLIGAYNYKAWTLILGQCIFALSGENTCIVISTWIGKWFPKEEQGVAQAINISFAHLWQAVLPGIITGFWNSDSHDTIHSSMLIAMWLMFASQIFSFLITLYSCRLDILSEKEEKALLQEQNNQMQGVTEITNEEGGGGHGFQLSDLKELGVQYWMLCLLLSIGYGGFNKFQTDFQTMVKVRYSMETSLSANVQQAGIYMSIPVLPLAGMLVDKIGRRNELLTGSFIVIFAMYCVMWFSPVYYDEYDSTALYWILVPQLVQGIAFGIFSAIIWSVFPMICSDKVLGTAFGIVDAMQSFIFGLFPFILGPVFADESRGQASNYIMFFVGVNAFNILLCICIWINDVRGQDVLKKTAEQLGKNRRSRICSKGSLRSAIKND